jgi:elongation factor G
MSGGKKPERPVLSVSFRLRDADIVIKTMDELYLEEVFTAVCNGEIPVVDRAPEAILLETICNAAEGEGKYIRQTGGSGNYGHVKIRLEATDIDAGFRFVNAMQPEALPRQYIAPIKQGIFEAARGGVLRGHEIVGARATLIDGSYHETDSNEMAFRIAASLAFTEAARKASPVLLEPMMEAEVMATEALIGAITEDINSRRGRIESIEHHASMIKIDAVVPLRETLRSSRHGRPDYPLSFLRYEPSSGFSEGGEEDHTGTGVRNPWRPGHGSASAAAKLDFDSE